MSIHHQAMHHLDRAKELLAKGQDEDLRYAALELRYAIEHLFYKLVPSFKAELPDDVVDGKVWRPADIIDMIADIEPRITADVILSIGTEPSPGARPERMVVLGKQTGIGKDLIRKAYHALGFYLHARTDGEPHDSGRLRRKLERLLPIIEKFRGDRVIASGFAARSIFRCVECGRTIAKRAQTIEANPFVRCPNRTCGAMYEATRAPDGHWLWTLIQQKIVCNACGGDMWLAEHKLAAGAAARGIVACDCGAKYQMEPQVLLRPLGVAGVASPVGG